VRVGDDWLSKEVSFYLRVVILDGITWVPPFCYFTALTSSLLNTDFETGVLATVTPPFPSAINLEDMPLWRDD